MRSVQRVLRPVIGWVCVAWLAACVSPAGIRPKVAIKSAASVGAVGTGFVAWPQQKWWQQYGDDTLNQLVEAALAQNIGLDGAKARWQAAQAAVVGTESTQLPQVGLGVGSMRQHFTETGLYPKPLAGSVNSVNNALLNASYEIDFWGKNAGVIQAALGQAQAAQAQMQAAQLVVASGVAKTYVQLARWAQVRHVLQLTLQARELQHSLQQQRVAAGLDTAIDLRQIESQIPSIRADLVAADEHINLTRHQLAAWLAQPPDSLQHIQPPLPAVPVPVLPDALPADLLVHRADVAAAKARVQATVGDMHAAKALFYPNINLTAFAGFSSIGLSRWGQSNSQTFGAGPALQLPIFDADRLRANLQIKAAEVDAAVSQYNQTVLDAARDVADQVTSLQATAEQWREHEQAMRSTQAAQQLAVQRQRAGLTTRLPVVQAELAVLVQQRTAVELAAKSFDLHIQLNRALGGGYQASESQP